MMREASEVQPADFSAGKNLKERINMFLQLAGMGVEQVDIGCPAGSETDYAFCRRLVKEGCVPLAVSLKLSCPANAEAVRKSLKALEGIENAVICLEPQSAAIYWHGSEDADNAEKAGSKEYADSTGDADSVGNADSTWKADLIRNRILERNLGNRKR